eukprot:scaffold8353_cov138-Cylindrotheca_fusiformis.AAC.6
METFYWQCRVAGSGTGIDKLGNEILTTVLELRYGGLPCTIPLLRPFMPPLLCRTEVTTTLLQCPKLRAKTVLNFLSHNGKKWRQFHTIGMGDSSNGQKKC